MAENIPDLLVVWAKDGSKPSFALSGNPKVTFTASHLVITAKDIEVEYALSNLQRLTYEKNDVTGVTDLSNGKTAFRLQHNTLYFPFLAAQSKIALYQTNGKLVLSRTISKEGAYTISLGELNAGTYLVRIDGFTYKISKR